MTPAIRELFDYTSRHVTPADISRYCPGDPGYGDYVRAYTEILSSGNPPKRADFDITETIGLTRGLNADDLPDPVRFRRFRTFASAVNVTLYTCDEGDELPANYFAISLLDDAHALQDESLLRLLSPVFADIQQSVIEAQWQPEEVPFLLLGQLLLAFQGYAPSADLPRLIEQLNAEAAQHAGKVSPWFFWGCTHYDQFHHRWKHFVRLWFPAKSPDEAVNTLRGALLLSPIGHS